MSTATIFQTATTNTMAFDIPGLSAPILKAIHEAGYTSPTPIQAAAIPPILEGHDVIGIAQTGTGKTAAFTLPMLSRLSRNSEGRAPGNNGRRRTRAIVLAPTRELVAQIEENVRGYAKHLPLRVATIFGGVGERAQIEALRVGADIIIATPGRLMDLMERRFGDFSSLEFFVLDEADRMLDMGFLPDMRRIAKALPQKRQTLLFSATLSREIERLTHEFQQEPKTIEIGQRANPAETITQHLYEVPHHLKAALLEHLLRDKRLDSVLVFTRTKHGADRVARKLEASRIRTATIHSNRSQNQRSRALEDFRSGGVRVLVATDIAARGIDVEGISHVVNFDFPMNPEDYVHRIGRTGRAQAIGDAVSFVTPEDRGPLRSLERFIGRQIPRLQAEGFDYSIATPARKEAGPYEPRTARRGKNGFQARPNRRPSRNRPRRRP